MEKHQDEKFKGPDLNIRSNSFSASGDVQEFCYTHTRVVETDRALLKRNRLMGLFCEEASADGIKMLRTRVLDKIEETGTKTLLVTSARRGEGRTITAANLAVSLCQIPGQSCLLVDSDIKRPSIQDLFGLGEQKGLTDYLLRQAQIPELLINPKIPKLVILPAGRAMRNSVELLSSPRMEALVKELGEFYQDRIVIFDSPPLLESADALVLSRYIDSVLLVVEAEKTSAKDVAGAMELLGEKTFLGAIFNKVLW